MGQNSEIQQLIERAVSGEFDVAQIEQATAVAELLSLLEQGLAKLPLRSRQFLLARIGGQTERGRRPRADLLCLSHAEIGRRYGLTRARVHKVFVNSIYSLRKIWGPRVPRLLEVIKWRCLSMICPLTPQLLEKWVGVACTLLVTPKTRGYPTSVSIIHGSARASNSGARQKYSLVAGNEPISRNTSTTLSTSSISLWRAWRAKPVGRSVLPKLIATSHNLENGILAR